MPKLAKKRPNSAFGISSIKNDLNLDPSDLLCNYTLTTSQTTICDLSGKICEFSSRSAVRGEVRDGHQCGGDDENEEVAGVPGGHPVVSVVIVNHPLQGSLLKFGDFAIRFESDFYKFGLC